MLIIRHIEPKVYINGMALSSVAGLAGRSPGVTVQYSNALTPAIPDGLFGRAGHAAVRRSEGRENAESRAGKAGCGGARGSEKIQGDVRRCTHRADQRSAHRAAAFARARDG